MINQAKPVMEGNNRFGMVCNRHEVMGKQGKARIHGVFNKKDGKINRITKLQ